MEVKMTTQEIRSFNTHIEIRDGTDGRVIEGYPIVFGKASEDLGGFVEYIDPKALNGVDLDEVYLIYGHDFNQPLARVDAGTLQLEVDKVGLHFTATLPNTTVANDVLENIRVGNIKGMSFGFTVAEGGEKWEMTNDGTPDVRTVTQIDEVFEITLTPLPAYKDTTVAIASRDALKKGYTIRDRLRDTVILAKIERNINYGN
jgi:HK97 family phage prohead protease